jgi:V/A-type H+-transporting ATPase subunit D
LLAALKQARRELHELQQQIDALHPRLAELFALLGSSTIASRDLASLIKIDHAEIDEENLLGTRLPVLRKVTFTRAEYSTFATPFWVDLLVESLERMADLRVQLAVRGKRVERLDAAARRITQRVNLFEKVLIPRAKENIRRIVISLSDHERAAVVSSKIAKKKHQ